MRQQQMKRREIIEYEEVAMSNLGDDDLELLQAAIKACDTAYAPYSHFHVGAAIRMADDSIMTGSNQENIAYPSGLCAERTALFAASAAHPGMAMKSLAIVGRTPEAKLTAASPCGACRQVMAEQESKQGEKLRVLCYHSEDKIVIFEGIKSLLPFVFTM